MNIGGEVLILPFSVLMEEYDFKQEDIYIVIETDFEFIKINMTDATEYLLERSDLIRFISDEFEDDEYEMNDHNMHAIYFLPSHKEKELCQYLNQEEFVSKWDQYYTPEMKENFKPTNVFEETIPLVQHKDRHTHGTSFYGVEEDVDLDELIKTAQDILALNAMKGYKIATGTVFGQLGLLERGRRLRTENPQSKHYSFWKFCESKTGRGFSDVGKGFRIISQGEKYEY